MPLSSLPELAFPVVVKPNSEGSSKGIFDQSVVKNMKEMKEAVKHLRLLIGGDVLVEEFLPGREFTVTVMGNKGIGDDVFILPPVEQNYDVFPSSMNKLASYEAKWFFEDNLPNPHDAYICPPILKKRLYKEIEQLCIQAYNALECRDIARIDLRLDREDNPSLLEINTIPGMIPDENVVSYYPVAARTLGWSYDKMVGKIVELALERQKSRFS
jgi:D-alanine-D-alanine ligase